MIKLFKVKEKQREIAENANGKAPVKKQSAGELRLHKGILSFILMMAFNLSYMFKDSYMKYLLSIFLFLFL